MFERDTLPLEAVKRRLRKPARATRSALQRPLIRAGFLVLVILCCLLAVLPSILPSLGKRSAAHAASVRSVIDTWRNIHLAQIYSSHISDPASMASAIDMVWGPNASQVSAFRSGNPNIFLTYVIPFSRDRGTFGNSTLDTLAFWQQSHPDWILYKCDKVTPAYLWNEPNMPLDFTNPAVINWQAQTYAAPASQAGYDGIAANDVNLANQSGACGVYRNGQWVQLFSGQPNDPQWATAIVSWLAQMQQALHDLPQPLALVPNLGLGSYASTDPLVQQVLNHVDGILEQGYQADTAWVQQMQLIIQAQQQNVSFYMINQFPTPVSDANLEWALASYLLSKEHRSALWVSDSAGYGSDTRSPAYTAQIGTPIGEMYPAQNVYWRNYSGGLVVANPSSTTSYMVTAGNGLFANTYHDVFGNPVPQVFTLPPRSGMVLLPAQANPLSVPDTWSGIHLAQIYSSHISNPASVAPYDDFVWGADPSQVSAFRSGNPNIFLTYYMTFHRDDGTFTNSALGTLASWQQSHPDWILYKCDKVTPAYEFGDPNIPLDFTNPAVLAWQMQAYIVPASQAGYNGIAADNVELENYSGACGAYRNGQWVPLFSGQLQDPLWANAVISWLSQTQHALHALPHPLALIPNLGWGEYATTDPLVQQVLSHVDGILDERGYKTDAAWVQKLHFILQAQQRNIPYYVINQFPSPVSNANLQWALASYLLSKEHMSALWVSGVQAYGSDTRYPAYTAQIGTPIGEMYTDQNVYWRQYSGGLVIANPSTTTSYTVTINTSFWLLYHDVFGNAVSQTATLPPHSGLVLLSS